MNKLTEGLAEQAKIAVRNKDYLPKSLSYVTNEEQILKFVELIVLECVKINNEELVYATRNRLLEKYAKHFGVDLTE